MAGWCAKGLMAGVPSKRFNWWQKIKDKASERLRAEGEISVITPKMLHPILRNATKPTHWQINTQDSMRSDFIPIYQQELNAASQAPVHLCLSIDGGNHRFMPILYRVRPALKSALWFNELRLKLGERAIGYIKFIFTAVFDLHGLVWRRAHMVDYVL